jgi:2-C-methyl-D-erythritol 4-phosphate cytidylyltransferase
MKQYSLLLLSGGLGTRMQQNIPKQHLLLFGRPIIIHSMERINKIPEIEKIVITCNKNYIDDLKVMLDNYNFTKEIVIVEGGRTRQESVLKGLSKITTNSVIIHEAARPFVRQKEFENLIKAKEKNVSFGINIPFTVLKGKNNFISESLTRSDLVNIQLPQKFDTEPLKKAHNRAVELGKEYTEDACLSLDLIDGEIKILKGTEFNIKITTPIDYKIAEVIYKHYILNEE